MNFIHYPEFTKRKVYSGVDILAKILLDFAKDLLDKRNNWDLDESFENGYLTDEDFDKYAEGGYK